ncbi:GL18079 [Drosophila persimilis]|uniref:GL18079 n=1 Tax=Drosophila persimilis TaxID=7234 RepID=B4IRD1_DROPE|nr:GL18079 [Drosophila persimilis]
MTYTPQINTIGVGKRKSKKKVKKEREPMLLSVGDDDNAEDEDDVKGAGDAAVPVHQKPQLDQLLILSDDINTDGGDDDDDDDDDEVEVLLSRNPSGNVASAALRNGTVNGRAKFKNHSEESSESRSSSATPQPQVISHIATTKATASAPSSPLKSATHIAIGRHPHDEADDICLVPEIDFEGMSTDAGSDNRESQPLLGGGSASHGSRISDLLGGLGRGHDHVDFISNTFGVPTT